MSVEHIQTLCMNPHFYGLLIQGFLSGYSKPCETRLVFMALPILMYSESRKKLSNANNRSKMETLFNSTDKLENNTKISGKVKLSGYLNRYEELKSWSKKSIIILYTEKKILFHEKSIVLVEPIKHLEYEDTVREWIKAAYYLGVVFSKSDEDHLNYFLGVER
ncbi:MAG: hypothetical protein CVU95_07765 [Firmicutes bacterium HGW-Firmicutes-2]|nr:MAG: hypothetical protein CVU95_07765 [Firmicutes bacterium HGW-Firmicutes-2]